MLQGFNKMKSPEVTHRAVRALRCTQITALALKQMGSGSLPLRDFVGVAGVKRGLTRSALSEIAAEDDLLWLIRLGVLRREVDGQGITDHFRLTPLGLKIAQTYTEGPVTPLEWGQDWVIRHLPY
jgi:hypothetical protein